MTYGRTIVVIEDDHVHESPLLDSNGDPIRYIPNKKFGFDLTPRDNNGNEKTNKVQRGCARSSW